MTHVHTLGQNKGLHVQAGPQQSRAPGSKQRGIPQRVLVAIALPPDQLLNPRRKLNRKINYRSAPSPEPCDAPFPDSTLRTCPPWPRVPAFSPRGRACTVLQRPASAGVAPVPVWGDRHGAKLAASAS
jgi:hypothetical protein